MPSDEAARQSSHPALIRTPDQLQQAKRPDAPVMGTAHDRRQQARATAAAECAGILGQLETERAHD